MDVKRSRDQENCGFSIDPEADRSPGLAPGDQMRSIRFHFFLAKNPAVTLVASVWCGRPTPAFIEAQSLTLDSLKIHSLSD
jgi:hypothetical protein